MNTKPISPKVHGIADYILVGGLLTLPSILGLKNKVRNFYAFEALTLFTYIGATDHPTAIKPIIPFSTHGKIDPFNIAQFALQSFWKPIRRSKKALLFNIGFTIIAASVVALTDWQGSTKSPHK
ncbi:MAG: hypothetical protein EOO85_23640 [Pedobacter sp.]|nr:MAG: hypothetical protein EOO85_23640 [Pedobacter sp.]